MQLKSRAAVHLDNEGGSLNRIVCDTENTSLKMIAKTAKVVWQKISRVDLGDCRCWKIFFLQFGKILNFKVETSCDSNTLLSLQNWSSRR